MEARSHVYHKLLSFTQLSLNWWMPVTLAEGWEKKQKANLTFGSEKQKTFVLKSTQKLRKSSERAMRYPYIAAWRKAQYYGTKAASRTQA